MNDELKRLRELRDAVHFIAHPMQSRDPSYGLQEFAYAAHAALGPDGCVTRELERLQRFETAGEGVTELELLRYENATLKSELEQLKALLSRAK